MIPKLLNYKDLVHSYKNDPTQIRRYVPDKFAKYVYIEAIPLLGETLLNEDDVLIVRIESAESLGKLGSDDGIYYLKKAFNTKHEELRRTIVWSLGQIGTPDVYSLFLQALNDSSPLVKRWTIKLLRRVRNINTENLFNQLEKEYLNYFDSDILLAEFFRTLLHFQTHIQKSYWMDEVENLLQNQKNPLLITSILHFIDEINYPLSNGIIDKLQVFYRTNGIKSPYHAPLISILFKIGYKDEIIQLIDTKLSPNFLYHIFRNLSVQSLINYLGQSEYNLSILKAFSDNNADIPFDINRYLASDNLDIFLVAMKIYINRGGAFNVLKNAIDKGKGVTTLIYLLQHFDMKGFDILADYAINGKKAKRQASIYVLINLYRVSKNPKIQHLLEGILQKERIWHLRRDIRIAIE